MDSIHHIIRPVDRREVEGMNEQKIIVSQYFWDSIHHVIRPVGRGEVEGMNEPKIIVSQYF